LAGAVEYAVKHGGLIGASLALPAILESAQWLKSMLVFMSTGSSGPPQGQREHAEGPGEWWSGAENLRDAPGRWQSQVSGKPPGWIYWLEMKWDAVNVAARELIDAKSASGNDL
jgi:hypothetical protein